MTLNPKDVLKQTFGYEEFRQGQNEIISSIVNKRNVLAIERIDGIPIRDIEALNTKTKL